MIYLFWYAIGVIFGFFAFTLFAYYLIKVNKYRFVEETTNTLEFSLMSDKDYYYLAEYLDEHDDYIYVYPLDKTTFKNVYLFICYLIFDSKILLSKNLNK
jgi:hypothetical protein